MNDPHAGQPVASVGPPPGTGPGVVIMLHGRGAGAENILELVPVLDRPQFTYLAPGAAGNTWYPYSFMSAIERNEPYLSSALGRIGRCQRDHRARRAKARVVLLDSRGGCPRAKACRHAARTRGGEVERRVCPPPPAYVEQPRSFDAPRCFSFAAIGIRTSRRARDESAAVLTASARLSPSASTRVWAHGERRRESPRAALPMPVG